MATHTKTSKKHVPRGAKKEYVVYTKDGKDYIKKKNAATGKMVYVPVTPKASPAKAPAKAAAKPKTPSPKGSPKSYVFRAKFTFELNFANSGRTPSTGERVELHPLGSEFEEAADMLEERLKHDKELAWFTKVEGVKSIVPELNRKKESIDFVVKASRALNEAELKKVKADITRELNYGWGEDSDTWAEGYDLYIASTVKLVK